MAHKIPNKIGICEWSMPYDGPYICKLASDIGIDGIQLNIMDYERGFPLTKKPVYEAYMETAERYGIEYPAVAARVTDFYTMFTCEDAEEGEIVRTAIRKAVDTCTVMKIPLILIPNFVKSEITNDEQFDEAVEVFRWACDMAADKGVTIAAENTLSVEKTKRFFEQVNRDNLRLYFDSQNYYLNEGYDSPRVLAELMPYVVQLHVKDGKNKDLSGALLGTGDAGFYRTVEVLKKYGYSGWVVLENYYDREPLSLVDEDPVKLIRDDVRILREALS